MTWYAVRTVPGSQKPQREYAVETTRSRKGYRIVPSLNANVSAVERALTDAGFIHYMPAEKRLLRDRLRPYLWKSRRFALMVGYVFVKAPCNLYALNDVPGVLAVVGNQGKPYEVPLIDILTLRSMEAEAEVEFDKAAREARQVIRKAARKDPSLKRIVDRLDIAGTLSFPLAEAIEHRAA